ncbi:MAG TPA: DUF1552 domain-containing protein [Polyangia bacterium]|nr:DUF1552 domain-containing protein [Polyangia bacterium]
MRSLSRRTFLRGAGGVTIALPFLDEMRTRSVWAAPAPAPARAFNIFLGGGVPELHQRAGLVGPLTPLLPFKDKMAFLRGIQGPDGHPIAAGAAFVGKSLVNDTTAGGPSIDNEIMRFAYPSGRPPTPIDVQGMGFYYKFLDNPSRWVKSWDQQGRPKGGLIDSPAALFTNFFGGAPGGAPAAPTPMPKAMPPAPTPEQKLATSVLDTVVGEYKFYTSDRSNLSAGSRSKLADHLDAIRQLENRVAGVSLVGQNGGAAGAGCTTPAAPAPGLYVATHHNGADSGGNVVATDFIRSFKVMADLWTMAVTCDLFRFGFTVVCCAGDGLTFTGPYTVAGQTVDLTTAGETHGTNHAMGDNPTPGSVALMHNGWHTHLFLECCSYVMQQLDKVTESNGKTILDNSFVLLGTDLGTNHIGRSVFYGVSQAGGKFKPGLYDVQGSLLDFLGSCKAAMGLGGMPAAGMSGFIA